MCFLIIRRSSSATIAMIPTVNRFAFGILAATRSTPAFSQPRGRDVQKILQKGKFREAGDGSSTDEMVSVQFARRFAVIATGIGFNHALENMA